ncbi:hypothetical protein KI387_031157, partial [Taxus chinensis]
MVSDFAHPMIPPSAELLRKQLECFQSEYDSCPPWDTARKMALSKRLRDMMDRYIRQKEAEESKLQEQAEAQSDKPFEPFPVRPPYQQRIRQRQVPTRGRTGPWRGRGRSSHPQRTFSFLFPEEQAQSSAGPSGTDIDPASIEVYKAWRKSRLELLQKVIANASEEYARLLAEEEKEKKDSEDSLEDTYQHIASQGKDHSEVCTISCTQNPFIAITICIPNIKPYILDAMVDTGAEISLLRQHAIPFDCWVNTHTKVRFDKREVVCKFMAKVLINIEGISMYIEFYQHNMESYDCLLGVEFLKNCHTFSISPEHLTLFDPPIKIQRRYSFQSIVPLPEKTKAINNIWIHKSIANCQVSIEEIVSKIKKNICNENPHAFVHRKKHNCSLDLQLIKDAEGKEIIPKFKAHHRSMPPSERKECHEEIQKLLKAGFIQESNSPWSCAAFYVNKRSEQLRNKKRLVVDYKPLNKFIAPVQHPIPAKDDLLSRIKGSKVYSKFDLKSGFWQIFLKSEDMYKTAFIVPGGQYEWKVLPFGLKTAPSIFQKIMDKIF